MAAPLVVTSQLSRRFGTTWALRGVTVEIQPGERVLLVGPNGAGKTTLLKVLATVLRPTSGKVYIFGLDAERHRKAIRPRLALLGHTPFLIEELTVAENLRLYATLYGAGPRTMWVVEELELGPIINKRVGSLSRGQVQRVALARALINDPELLLLDEPETGLDQTAFQALCKAISQVGSTLLLSTHQWDRYTDILGRALIMEDGKIVADVSAAELGHVFISRG